MSNASTYYDAVVVGAGFGGIYMTHKIQNDLGLSVRTFDTAEGVGGTWFWNRYPGALSDTESHVYRFSFDKDLLQEWDWNKRFLSQPEILEYLNHVVDRYGIRDNFQLATKVETARFDEFSELWHIRTSTDEHFTAKYFITSLGLLAATHYPALKGVESFAGEIYHTSQWPESVDLEGKRVGVIGTGSSGTQVATAIAPVVAQLTVFQRTAQYCIPALNRPMSPEEVVAIKSSYSEIWDNIWNSTLGFGFEESDVPTMSVSEKDRNEIFEKAWTEGGGYGGFKFLFGTFNDIAVNEEANKIAQEFVRRKIQSTVNDPEKARKLTPTGLFAKRPVCVNGYYEIFNRSNVDIVSTKETPIAEVTSSGMRLSDGTEHEFDVLIYATGFDAVDGNYKRMKIYGHDNVLLKDHWGDAPSGYLGLTTAGFPNMFMIIGPNGPFTNLPPAIETEVEFISEVIRDAERRGIATVDTNKEAESEWNAMCREIAFATLFAKGDSWIFGSNIPGKKETVLFYLGGLSTYRRKLKDVKDNDWEGFEMDPKQHTEAVS